MRADEDILGDWSAERCVGATHGVARSSGAYYPLCF